MRSWDEKPVPEFMCDEIHDAYFTLPRHGENLARLAEETWSRSSLGTAPDNQHTVAETQNNKEEVKP